MIDKKIKFFKYHGTGNDFILINSFEKEIKFTKEDIRLLCHRRFGVGADGLMLLKKSEEYDFEMDFYNSDGNKGSMCGNGGRCIVAFAKDSEIIKDKTVFLAPDGVHKAMYYSHNKIKLQLKDVSKIEEHSLGLFLDTGSPHLVIYNEDNNIDVYSEGHKIRYSDFYKKNGVNVNFVVYNNSIKEIYTYERGVENQTYSCGTGTVASAISLNKTKGIKSPVKLKTLGGDLIVYFENTKKDFYNNIWLEGPVVKVFEGIYSRK
jgi:diaminopimelate epimerase